MSRVRRLLFTDRVFFVTVNLRRRIPGLEADEYPLMIQALQQSRQKLGFKLCGYVLMPDHWHALLAVHHPLTVLRAVQDIKWIAARFDYMHLNPVRKGLAKRREDWRWSSYNNYALEPARVAQCPIRVDYIRL